MSAAPMMVAAAWAASVLAVAWSYRPRPASPAATLTSFARRRGVAVGLTALAVAGTLVVAPLAAPLVAIAGWTAPRAMTSRARRRQRTAIIGDIPEVVDLLALAVGAGCTVSRAVAAVARWGAGPLAVELACVSADADAGRRLADCLEELEGRLGDDIRPLTTGLIACDRYGAPIGATLERLAGETRAASRRRAEAAARRIPVKLVFPLVGCILPAFALLTVAPLIAGALAALRR